MQEIIDEGWHSLAGFAWMQYQQYGRGAVGADFALAQLQYAIADALHGDPEFRELFDLCQRYDPMREFVLVTEVIPRRGRENDRRFYMSGVTPHGDYLSPPEAFAYIQRAEEQHRLWTIVRDKASAGLDEADWETSVESTGSGDICAVIGDWTKRNGEGNHWTRNRCSPSARVARP